MSWRGILLIALLVGVVTHYAAGQQPACAGALNKRAREFVGGTLNQGSALTLTPPPNQAVLPPDFCEYWTVRPDQLKNTTCHPTSPSAGLSYLLVELWLGASWNTTGTSPNWDDVDLSVYRMSNMDDDTWTTRKTTGYGYTRYLDKTNGMAYHRVIVSTFQKPGAASRDNTTIENDFDLDPWYMSIDNADGSRSSNGYTLKVSCVDPNSLPCPSSGPASPDCNSRGQCMTNETLVGKSAPVNYCQCAGDFEGFACQTSTADPAAVAQTQAQQQMENEAAFAFDSSIPMNSTEERKKKKSSFDARILLVLLIIPIAILGFIIWRAVANKNERQKVADEPAAKAPPADENKDKMQSIRVDPLIVPAPILTTTVEEAPKPKWAPAPPVVVKKPERNQFAYPVLPAAAEKEKEPEKDTNSSTTEVPVAVDGARERFYAERSLREKRRTGSGREAKDPRSASRSGRDGRRDGRKDDRRDEGRSSNARRTHTLRSVDLEEYNRMMKSEDEGLYYRKDRHGRDLLTSFDRESFRETSHGRSKGRSGSRGRDREMSTFSDLDDGYDTYRSGYETGRSSRREREEYRHRSSSAKRHSSAGRRHGSSGRRRPELDTLQSDVTQSEMQSKVTSLSDTEVDSFLDFTPSMVEKIPGRRSAQRGSKYDSDREGPVYREKGSKYDSDRDVPLYREKGKEVTASGKFTKKGKAEKDRYSSPAQRRAEVEETIDKEGGDRETESLVEEPVKGKKSSKPVSKTRKMREQAEEEFVDTVETLSMSTLDAEPKFLSRRSRAESDVDTMLEAALTRDKEKEEKRLAKEKKSKGKSQADVVDDAATVEDVKSDVVSRVSVISKYSKDSDKLMSKSGRKSSKKAADVEGDAPSSSSGPSFQKANSRAKRAAAQDKIPEHSEAEGDDSRILDSMVSEDVPVVERERHEKRERRGHREQAKAVDAVEAEDAPAAERERHEKKKSVSKKERVKKVEEEDVETEEPQLTEQELAAQREAEAAELRAKQAAEERRQRFAAILNQLPDINEHSFQRGSREASNDDTLQKPEPVAVQDYSYPVFSSTTLPTTTLPTTTPPPPPLPELQVVTVKEVATEVAPLKQATPAKKKGWFGFGARSSRETPASPAPVSPAPAEKTATSISIHEVQPAVPLADTANPASPLNSTSSVDLRDGWRMIQQRYSSSTPTNV